MCVRQTEGLKQEMGPGTLEGGGPGKWNIGLGS